MGNFRAKRGEFFGSLEEINYFLKLCLFFVSACHIREKNLVLVVGGHFYASLAEGIELAARTLACLIHHNYPKHDEYYYNENVRENTCPPRKHRLGQVVVFLQIGIVLYIFLNKRLEKREVAELIFNLDQLFAIVGEELSILSVGRAFSRHFHGEVMVFVNLEIDYRVLFKVADNVTENGILCGLVVSHQRGYRKYYHGKQYDVKNYDLEVILHYSLLWRFYILGHL